MGGTDEWLLLTSNLPHIMYVYEDIGLKNFLKIIGLVLNLLKWFFVVFRFLDHLINATCKFLEISDLRWEE